MSEVTDSQQEAMVRKVFEDMEAREKVMTDVVFFDQNGHLVHAWPSEHVIQGTTLERVQRLFEEVPEIPLSSHLGMFGMRCTYCGERPRIGFDGKGGVVLATPCPAVNGVQTSVELRVPSGKIVVADSLGDVYNPDWHDEGRIDYNTRKGQGDVVKLYEEIGCAYGPVGNSCPGLYRLSDGSYIVANPAYNDDNEPTGIDGVQVASICTDLWAYSIADHDDYLTKGGDVSAADVVDVEPGTYRFVHHTGERTFKHDDDGVVIYATITKIA